MPDIIGAKIQDLGDRTDGTDHDVEVYNILREMDTWLIHFDRFSSLEKLSKTTIELLPGLENRIDQIVKSINSLILRCDELEKTPVSEFVEKLININSNIRKELDTQINSTHEMIADSTEKINTKFHNNETELSNRIGYNENDCTDLKSRVTDIENQVKYL